MFFFCKPKTVVIDAFTVDVGAIRIPPAPAIKFRPKWWHDLNPTIEDTYSHGIKHTSTNIRKCKGFKSYYSDRNIILPLWTSVVFECGESGFKYVHPSETQSKILFQEEVFRGGYLSNYYHFKIVSPWMFKEKSGIGFMFSQAFYNFKDPTEFLIPPGTVDYRVQHATHIHFFSKKREDDGVNRIELNAGQPLIHITPMTEKRVVVKPHLVSQQEYERVTMPTLFFTDVYNRMKNL